MNVNEERWIEDAQGRGEADEERRGKGTVDGVDGVDEDTAADAGEGGA